MPTLADVLRQTGYSQDGTLATPTPTESPMTKALAEHIKTLPQQIETNQRAMDRTMAGMFKTDFMGKPNPNYYPEAMNEFTQMMPNFAGMIAYHGTPHNILGKFDISKVGTGEGAQAYGHGMYFAENPSVAEGYRVALSYDPDKMRIAGKQINDYYNQIQNVATKVHPSKATAEYQKMEILENLMMNRLPNELDETIKGMLPETKQWFEKTVKPSFETYGNLYKVDIPDEYIPNMLDWDKPISQQSDIVKKALNLPEDKFAGFKVPATGTNYSFSSNMTGAEFYKELTDLAKTQAGASEMLNSMGIKGIRYLDEGSRNIPTPDIDYYAKGVEKLKQLYKKQPTEANKFALDDAMQKLESVKKSQKDITSNFVVFDPSEVKILEKNSKPVSRKELIEEQVNKLKD